MTAIVLVTTPSASPAHLVSILLRPRPPTSTLFPYTTLFRSGCASRRRLTERRAPRSPPARWPPDPVSAAAAPHPAAGGEDRKSTRLNSSHVRISYAVFCLKKKKTFALSTSLTSPDAHGMRVV